MKDFIARFRKFLIAAPGIVAALVTAGLIDGDTGTIVSSAIGTVTAILVILVPNALDPAAVDAAVEAKLNEAPNLDHEA